MPDAPPTLLAATLTEQGITQACLARRAHLSTKHVNHLCQGIARISVDVALRLEYVLGVDAADWLADEAVRRVDAARDSAMLAAVADQLVWWRKARCDDLDLIGRLSDERDDFRERLTAAGLLPVAQPPGATELPCSLAIIRTFQGQPRAHCSHTWEPQPGMTPVWCPGISAELPTPVGTATATANELPASLGTSEPHSCDNCDGIDPASCPFRPKGTPPCP